MADFFDSAINGIGSAVGAALNDLGGAANSLNGSNPLTRSQIASFQSNGFLVNSTPTADGNGLPFSKITPAINAQIKRNIITWFVPQFGTVRMFINPQNISYNHKKLINRERTKGGFLLQYWGEELSTLNINGTTGSSGIEGINMLYEIYRAEQYAFDAVGLTLAANNASADVSNNIVQGIAGIIGGSDLTATAGAAGILGGILGLDSPNNNLSARNIPSLASLACSVEMYYGGKIFRGFFDSMTINEQASDFLINYSMVFVVTQQRGYRTNNFAWSNSPVSGASSYGTPPSFSGTATVGPTLGVSNTATPVNGLF